MARVTPSVRAHSAEDYRALRALWETEDGESSLGLSTADAETSFATFLDRNLGLSFGLWEGRELVGSVLTGHDGRRGYLYHLIVRPDRRRHGLGRILVDRALAGLASAGIQKTHVMVYAANSDGRRFWERVGFVARDELVVLSKETDAARAVGE